MKTITRRSVVKGIASTAIMTTAAALAPAIIGCRNRRIDLNVVLHGLFLLNVTDDKIELLTPAVKEHTYQAGSWDYSLVRPLLPGQRYELMGATHAMQPPFLDSDCNAAFAHPPFDFNINSSASHCCISLPHPEEIHYLRCVQDGDNEYAPPTSVRLKTFALCQALVYSVEDHQGLKLTNLDWVPQVNPRTNTANLHFWAEPNKKLTASHAQQAYDKLSDLTAPLKVQLGTHMGAPLDSHTGVVGLSREEELGLSEWIDGGETSHPTNCNVVTLDQTTRPKALHKSYPTKKEADV